MCISSYCNLISQLIMAFTPLSYKSIGLLVHLGDTSLPLKIITLGGDCASVGHYEIGDDDKKCYAIKQLLAWHFYFSIYLAFIIISL